MNDVTLHSGLHQTNNLEQILLSMCPYGQPRLSLHNNGWYCNIEMNTNAIGASFKVASEFGHKTPMSATWECYDRMLRAVKAVGSAVATANPGSVVPKW